LKRILITGGAGFIGSTLADKLLERGDEVVCLDNFSPQVSTMSSPFGCIISLFLPRHGFARGYFFLQLKITLIAVFSKAAFGEGGLDGASRFPTMVAVLKSACRCQGFNPQKPPPTPLAFAEVVIPSCRAYRSAVRRREAGTTPDASLCGVPCCPRRVRHLSFGLPCRTIR